MQLEDWLDDLCVRFIINLPPEELSSVERICFQVEEAQWFYEDFIRPQDPSLPSLSLKAFSLRIFQHCPLFSQWSAQHHSTAFAEFMAYKQRVPVRGAIMLNDAMDEVVLVKGWKKNANWSFPRGKINKEENDLDCAIREVYEETGLDLRAAGLVKDESEMKAIDMTMREQHMRLYVFRGVPKETHFEPRTRKEISKIEWYKIADLPTQKKHKHQDSNGATGPVLKANDVYMVAPFLGHLKKWIGQQRKLDNKRYSSHLAGPPITADEYGFDEIPVQPDEGEIHHYPQIPSDLPEVTISRTRDPSSHLKELLKIGPAETQPMPNPNPRPSHIPGMDATKSNALLSLLRGGATAELRAGPLTPLEQISFPPQAPRSPHHSHVRTPPSNVAQPPTLFNIQSELPTSPQHHPSIPPMRPIQQSNIAPFPQPVFAPPPARSGQHMAPYQQTGDPDFARQHPSMPSGSVVPPASALPKLTSHTKSLLDVLKGSPGPAPSPALGALSSQSQLLMDMLKPGSSSILPVPAVARVPTANFLDKDTQSQVQVQRNVQMPPKEERRDTSVTGTTIHRPKAVQQSSLLDLFSQRGPSVSSPLNPIRSSPVKAPIELAANPPGTVSSKQSNEQALLALLRQQNESAADASNKAKRSKSTLKEGQTAATINGPLNQPNFEAIMRPSKDTTNNMGRSPLTTHRKLFDPKQPNVKILARPEEQQHVPADATRQPKNRVATSSPKRGGNQVKKEAAKPFQPQILRRPQTEERSSPLSPDTLGTSQILNDRAVVANSTSMSRKVSSDQEAVQPPPPERKASHPDAHKQTLLSLFGGSVLGGQKSSLPQTPSRVVSPLSVSQIVSPGTEVPVSAVEQPISTRSRMGSLTSVGSTVAPTRPTLEKRQTAAENKAFLLGYLGRIATQEG